MTAGHSADADRQGNGQAKAATCQGPGSGAEAHAAHAPDGGATKGGRGAGGPAVRAPRILMAGAVPRGWGAPSG